MKKLFTCLVVGCAVGFALGFTEEIILNATNAKPETRAKVSKATTVATGAAAIATLIIA